MDERLAAIFATIPAGDISVVAAAALGMAEARSISVRSITEIKNRMQMRGQSASSASPALRRWGRGAETGHA